MWDMQVQTQEQECAGRIVRALSAVAGHAPTATPWLIDRNVASLEEVPVEVLPPGPARELALELARKGYAVEAYQGAGPARPWNLWVESERITCAEWVAWHRPGGRP